jgi:UDP-glucose 4-epimerase
MRGALRVKLFQGVSKIFMDGKKILVTGGAGFVGSNLCRELYSKGCDVTSLDNYFTGSEKNHTKGVNYVRGDTRDIFNLIKIRPDIVFHLGEYSRVEQSFEDADLVWQYNRTGMISVLQFCTDFKCKLVYAGSSTKFGDGGLGASQSPYAFSKASNTELVNCYGDWFDLEYAITYFYNVYGENEIMCGRYATLIGIFLERYLSGEPLPVVAPGTQVRNFTHIDDIVSGLLLVGKEGLGDGFGIGSPEQYSILEVAKMFGGDISMLPERRGNRQSADLYVENTRQLGWTPTHSLPDFIAKFRSEL